VAAGTVPVAAPSHSRKGARLMDERHIHILIEVVRLILEIVGATK
jgi:hypothetical protein